MNIIFSSKSYNDLLNEVYSYPEVETGGIFLGHKIDNTWYIIEMIDPGYKNVIRKHSYFEYDEEYVTHLANIISKKYEKKLSLLGLWHRHPGSMDTFSLTDDTTNKKFSKLNNYGSISGLVNIDPNFRLTFYYVPSFSFLGRPKYEKIMSIKKGDDYIPNNLLKLNFIEEEKCKLTSHLITEENHPKDKGVTRMDNISEQKLFDTLDIELNYLDSYNYSYEILPINFNDKSLIIKLFNLEIQETSFLLTLIMKIQINDSHEVIYNIDINNEQNINGIYENSLFQKVINNYIFINSNQDSLYGTRDKEEIDNIFFINDWLKKIDYLKIIQLDYKKEDLKKAKKVLLNILHTDRKGNNETNEETEKLDNIAKNINASISYLEKKLKIVEDR